jgi:hypothetical protein
MIKKWGRYPNEQNEKNIQIEQIEKNKLNESLNIRYKTIDNKSIKNIIVVSKKFI